MDPNNDETKTIIKAKQPSEKAYGWQIEITDISGSLPLEDAKFQVITNEATLEYSVTISDANPAAFTKGSSTVYAMTKGTSAVQDARNNNTVDGSTLFSDYSGCYIAFLDQTGDGKINGGDALYIYKDYDDDSTNEVLANYEIKIMYDAELVLNKVL